MKVDLAKVILSVLCAYTAAGCANVQVASVNASKDNSRMVEANVRLGAVVEETAKPSVSTRNRAAKASDEIWARIKVPMQKHDYAAARKIALTREEKETADTEFSSMLLALRIGLVTSVINPAECAWTLDELTTRIDSLCAKRDFAAAYHVLDEAKCQWNDATYAKFDDSLEQLRKNLEELFYSEGESRRYIGEVEDEIRCLMNGRDIDKLVKHRDLNDTLDEIMRNLTAELPKDRQAEVEKVAGRLKEKAYQRKMSTEEMASIVRNRIAELRALVSVRETVAGRGDAAKTLPLHVEDFDCENKIAVMEDAARRNAYGRGLLFAESARSFRALKLKKSQVDFQDILTAAILMRDRRTIELALACGADINKAASHEGAIPVLLAVEIGDAELIAWLCDKGARSSLVSASHAAFDIAISHDRLMLFKLLESVGCVAGIQDLFGRCCEKGADNVFGYLVAKGVKPSNDDFIKAVMAGNLIIVKHFVEKWNFDVNATDVPAAAKDCKGVREYLVERGMQSRRE